MSHPIRPRKPPLALLMSLVPPGFGQLYNGQLNKALWLFLIFALLCVPGVAAVALYLPRGWMILALVLGLALTLAVWLYGMADAWLVARGRPDYVPPAWQTSVVYPLALILCSVLILPLSIGYVRGHLVESFRVPSASMAPTVLPGDILFADKRYNCPGCKGEVRRGDIAIFSYPNDRTRYYIKRIIGLPGDRVRVEKGSVEVNGKPLEVGREAVDGRTLVTEAIGGRRWQVLEARASGGSAKPDVDITVPSGRVFVLGDNRPAATDSRDFGTVPLRDVVGKARQVWFSKGSEGVRWNRLGLVLDR
jgi:signal peptidase I